MHAGPITCLCITRDHRWLVAGSQDKLIKLVEFEMEDRVTTIASGGQRKNYLAASRLKSDIVFCEGDDNITICQLTRAQPDRIHIKSEERILCMDISASGQYMATGDSRF